MAEYKHFRIIVDLSPFFSDHRRVARIFVKRNLKTIADLQNRISEIFEISEFYLTTGVHFLPASEDIRILSNNESVCVIPYKTQETTRQLNLPGTSSTEIGHRKHKKPLESIPEDSGETLTRRKKKGKKKRVDITVYSNNSEDEVPRKKKKSENNECLILDKAYSVENNQKKDNQNGDDAVFKPYDSISEAELSPNKGQKQSIVEQHICNIESSQKIIDIKKKLAKKADEYIKTHSKEPSSNSVDTCSNIKNVLPKLQNHIKNCNNFSGSNLSYAVRLSRHVDTPIKTFSRYKPPPRITDTYLAKNKINIVKIDVVKTGSDEVIEQANISQSSASSENTCGASNENIEKASFFHNSDVSDSPPKNYVKEVINTFEKNISPEPKTHIREQKTNELIGKKLEGQENEASDYTKAFLDQRVPSELANSQLVADIAFNVKKNCVDVATVSCTLNELEFQESHSETQILKPEDSFTAKPLNEEMESTHISLDISSTDMDLDTSYYLSSNNTSFSPTNTFLNNPSVKMRNTTIKSFGGVGSLLERLRESDSVISHESDASTQYVTKRKRIRKHKSKSKKSDEEQKPAPVKEDTYVAKPMNVKTCPSIHIKFDDNEMVTLDEKSVEIVNGINKTNRDSSMVNQIGESESGHLQQAIDIHENQPSFVETVTLSDENDDPIMENKSIFGEESIVKAPIMTNKLEPKIGDVIAFKIIKMTKDYTPQVSSYIVGKLENYLVESKTVYFKILRGEEELRPPTGKLSINVDSDEHPIRYREFLWTDLLEPKLLYP